MEHCVICGKFLPKESHFFCDDCYRTNGYAIMLKELAREALMNAYSLFKVATPTIMLWAFGLAIIAIISGNYLIYALSLVGFFLGVISFALSKG